MHAEGNRQCEGIVQINKQSASQPGSRRNVGRLQHTGKQSVTLHTGKCRTLVRNRSHHRHRECIYEARAPGLILATQKHGQLAPARAFSGQAGFAMCTSRGCHVNGGIQTGCKQHMKRGHECMRNAWRVQTATPPMTAPHTSSKVPQRARNALQVCA